MIPSLHHLFRDSGGHWENLDIEDPSASYKISARGIRVDSVVFERRHSLLL